MIHSLQLQVNRKKKKEKKKGEALIDHSMLCTEVNEILNEGVIQPLCLLFIAFNNDQLAPAPGNRKKKVNTHGMPFTDVMKS